MNKIRELRFGPAGTWKTSSIVNTYPKPMLVSNWDSGGLDSVTLPKLILSEPDLDSALKNPAFLWDGEVRVFVRDYTERVAMIGESYLTKTSAIPMQSQIRDFNRLISASPCPIETLVIDGGTRFIESLMSFIMNLNGKDRPNMDLYGLLGMKAVELFNNIVSSLPCHVVITAHSQTEKDELTGETYILPNMLGSIREKIGGIMSQYLYSTVEMDTTGVNRGKVWTQPKGLCKGLKMRWPQDRPAVCNPDFESLYGELKK